MCPMKANSLFFFQKFEKRNIFLFTFIFLAALVYVISNCIRWHYIFLQNGSKWLTGWIKNTGIIRIGPFISCTTIRSMYLIERMRVYCSYIVTMSFGFFFVKLKKKTFIVYCIAQSDTSIFMLLVNFLVTSFIETSRYIRAKNDSIL